MKYNLNEAIEILERIPAILNAYCKDLPDTWAKSNEGENTWSPYDIVGHLIHNELTDWIPRAEIILSEIDDKTFEPFDRFAQFENSEGKSINELLEEFTELRHANMVKLKAFELESHHYEKTGIHPSFGEVSLEQLLATWVVHDLGHIGQISRVMAKQYKDEVGPWRAYLRVIRD